MIETAHSLVYDGATVAALLRIKFSTSADMQVHPTSHRLQLHERSMDIQHNHYGVEINTLYWRCPLASLQLLHEL